MTWKANHRYVAFVFLAVLSVTLAVSSFLLWVVFPRGYYPSRAVWVAIHKWGGLALTISVLIHVLMHWRWIVHMTRRHLTPRQTAVQVQSSDRPAPTRASFDYLASQRSACADTDQLDTQTNPAQ